MNTLTHILGVAVLVVAALLVSAALRADEFDDILGPDPAVLSYAEDDLDVPWTPPPPYVLPPALGPAIAPALQDLPLPPGFTALQFDQMRTALTVALSRQTVLTSTGLVVLCPPVLGDPLKSLESWLRIARAADITELPTYASGTPAWVRWRQLSASPLTTEADWIGFYRSLRS
ncbi:hypothetical protein OPIT5_08360 [Opitutaceae bacterium TAV5]|nr:hypothetical protein OPIT5_08360 [Opitutaceae bacterium TAV5]